MLKPKIDFIYPEEYLDMEETAEVKSEYYHGETFAMSGASHNHNVIAVNITAALHRALLDRDCFVYAGDMKVELDRDMHYAYPDVSVVCGKVQFVEGRKDAITNPIVIVEVLSESTQDYDRGSKFRAYRNISSLIDYIIVDQYSVSVEYSHKDESGLWVLKDFNKIEDHMIMDSLGITLSLKQIYHRVAI